MENQQLNEIHITGEAAAVLAIAYRLESRFPDELNAAMVMRTGDVEIWRTSGVQE